MFTSWLCTRASLNVTFGTAVHSCVAERMSVGSEGACSFNSAVSIQAGQLFKNQKAKPKSYMDFGTQWKRV